MRKFTDSTGRDWELSVNVMTATRVKDQTGVDLLDLEALSGTLGNVYTLVNVLWILVSKQAEKLGVDDESFGASLAGDAIEAATDSLMEEIINFFPLQRRKVLTMALEKSKSLLTAMTEQAEARIQKLTVGDLSGVASEL